MGKLLDLMRGAVPQQRQARSVTGTLAKITIVGEDSYQPHIRRVARAANGGAVQIVLDPQPGNPHDRNAVAVRVDGGVVGYLPRALAAKWQPAVLAAASEGFAVTGRATCHGGTVDKPSIGVFGSAVWPGPGSPPAP
jgi:hypothetical protein